MSRKSKGINAERELIHLLWGRRWCAIRVAGSGSSRYPSPDVLAGNAARRLAIECKTCSEEAKYLSKKEVEELKGFAKNFGAEPWVGVRFEGEWFFLSPDDLKETGRGFVVSRGLAKSRGLIIDELLSA